MREAIGARSQHPFGEEHLMREAIIGHRKSSEVIRCCSYLMRQALRGHQSSSEGHQKVVRSEQTHSDAQLAAGGEIEARSHLDRVAAHREEQDAHAER